MFRRTRFVFSQTQGLFEVSSERSNRRASGAGRQSRGPSHREPAARAAGLRAKRPSPLLRRPPDLDLAGPVPLQRIRGFVVPDDLPSSPLHRTLRGKGQRADRARPAQCVRQAHVQLGFRARRPPSRSTRTRADFVAPASLQPRPSGRPSLNAQAQEFSHGDTHSGHQGEAR